MSILNKADGLMGGCVLCGLFLIWETAFAGHPLAAPGVTTLTDLNVPFERVDSHYLVMERADVRVVIVDNAAVDVPELPGHRAGYNGVASLIHRARETNLFVAAYAGLNFEHIHDGTTVGLKEKFEPRQSPMELRRIDAYTVEVYQPPTTNWRLESSGRYQLLDDGTIEYTFECIPLAGGYRRGYIGLFWASYIQQPSDLAIWFKGRERGTTGSDRWIRAASPRHGVSSTHAPMGDPKLSRVDDDFPLTLVNHPSGFVVSEPWYFGVSHNMAFVQMFRERDRIWIAQSPSGGGTGNPAWDFQWFIEDYRVNEAYGFVMRAVDVPFESPEQIEKATQDHRRTLSELGR